MSRAQNFYYQDPTAAISNSMVTAIFGNPQLAAQQREQQAALDERRAHISAANLDTINAEIDDYFSQYGITLGQNARNNVRSGAITRFQQSGNPVAAVQQTIKSLSDQGRAARTPPPPAAHGQTPPAVVRVKSLEEAMALKPGTPYLTPDGKPYVR